MNHLDQELMKAEQANARAEAEEKQHLAEEQSAEILRTTSLANEGPKGYDYPAAIQNGQQFDEVENGGFNLANINFEKGAFHLDGVDIPTGENIMGGSPDELQKQGMVELKDSYTNTKRGHPPKDIVSLSKIVPGMIKGGRTIEDLDTDGRFTNDEKQSAWTAGMSLVATEYVAKEIEEGTLEDPGDPEMSLIQWDPEEPMTTDMLSENPEWLESAQIVYTSITGEEFKGEPSELHDWAMDEMANFTWDPITTGRRAWKITSDTYPPEAATAYGRLMQYYQHVDTDAGVVGNSLFHGVFSFANLAGVGILGKAVLGKAGTIAAQNIILRHIQSKVAQAAATGAIVGGIEGAVFGGLDAAAKLEIMKAGNWDVSEMPTLWEGSLMGAAGGMIFGGGLGAGLSEPAIKAYVKGLTRMRLNYENAVLKPRYRSPASQRGSFSLDTPKTANAAPDSPDSLGFPDQGVRIADTSTGIWYSRLFDAAESPTGINIIGKKGGKASEVLQNIEGALNSKKGNAPFSADEVKDTRVLEWLKSKGDEKVSKNEVLDYLYANRNRLNATDTPAGGGKGKAQEYPSSPVKGNIMPEHVEQTIRKNYQREIIRRINPDTTAKEMNELMAASPEEMLAYLRKNDETIISGPTKYDPMNMFDKGHLSQVDEMADMLGDPNYNQYNEDVIPFDNEYKEMRIFHPFEEDSLVEIAKGRFGKEYPDLTPDELSRAKEIQRLMTERKPSVEDSFSERIHYLGDVNRMAHVRTTAAYDSAGQKVRMVHELQSDMANVYRDHKKLQKAAAKKGRVKEDTKAIKNLKMVETADEATVTAFIQKALENGDNKIAFPASEQQLIDIEWKGVRPDLEEISEEQMKSLLEHYTKKIPKIIKKKYGENVEFKMETIYSRPDLDGLNRASEDLNGDVLVITFKDGYKPEKMNLNGFVAAPAGAVAIGQEKDDNHRHAKRDSKGHFIK